MASPCSQAIGYYPRNTTHFPVITQVQILQCRAFIIPSHMIAYEITSRRQFQNLRRESNSEKHHLSFKQRIISEGLENYRLKYRIIKYLSHKVDFILCHRHYQSHDWVWSQRRIHTGGLFIHAQRVLSNQTWGSQSLNTSQITADILKIEDTHLSWTRRGWFHQGNLLLWPCHCSTEPSLRQCAKWLLTQQVGSSAF